MQAYNPLLHSSEFGQVVRNASGVFVFGVHGTGVKAGGTGVGAGVGGAGVGAGVGAAVVVVVVGAGVGGGNVVVDKEINSDPESTDVAVTSENGWQ